MNTLSLSIQAIDITNQQTVLALKLNTDQNSFIESIPDCLQEAKQDPRFTPVALYYGEDIAGFAMFGQFEECDQLTVDEQTRQANKKPSSRVWFDRFLIDKRFQGKGLGKRFAKLLLNTLFEHFACQQMFLSVYPNNHKAIALYKQLGFEFTGEYVCEGERVMSCQRDALNTNC
ncbi:spermine/spermidine acetyltransferase [Shewanella sairae]|uniref:Spermine/spermidine acetyltransferase n=1 Tax=Shewanella sairae TaxID=190310 RepID=A0ABQ4P3D7_9GAMM|nr:GNAT family N-acetyltransferase [Shewanella sairae]MCL1128608.1 GNAT family N-acetyltransferase [Shewanella sairae]GIU42010.1 spermine/spermidine acetyltransferase [Shewanella sairae]